MRFLPGFFLAAAGLCALLALSVVYGQADIPAAQIFPALLRGLGLDPAALAPPDRIIFDLRLPRALFTALIGGGLGVVGVLLQTTTRNDLADPFLFGLSSGAAAGAVFVITVTGDIFGRWTLPLAAFTGGVVASAAVLGLMARLRSAAPDRLILAGLAVSFLFSAATNYLIFAGDNRAAHSVIFWMLGGLGLARWESFPLVLAGFVFILAACLYFHRQLDALLAGDQTARSLGVSVGRLRYGLFFAAALSTAVFVAAAGVIGFVGLMVPHIARALVGPLHRRLILSAALIGAMLLTASDLLARMLLAPQELPVGIITTALGAAFVFALLLSRRPPG